MWPLYLGILLFAGPHLWSLLARQQRDETKARWGEGAYKGLYSLLSVAGLALMAWGYARGRGDSGLFYEPMTGAKHFMFLLVFLGFVLIFSNMTKGYIRKYVQHPFSIGIALWSIGHLLMNGESAVVIIFATFLLLSIVDVALGFSRGPKIIEHPNWKHDLRGVIVGTILFLVFMLGFHPYVLGIPVTG